MSRKRARVKIRYGRLVILTIALISFIILGAGMGFVVGAVRSMPQYDLDNITGDLSSFIIDKDGQVVTNLRTEKNRVQLEPNEIPKVMKHATVAIEDQRFYKHNGFDPIRFFGAVVANIKEGYGAQGGSTLTQQLVKNAVLENTEKKLRRKIQEAIIAFKVENKYDKDQILALYLNNVYYGHGCWSLQTASQTYYGKDAKDLQLEEAAMLAGVINAPGRYSPYLNMEKAKQRQALVLNEMVKMNYISQETADEAKEKPINLVGLKPYNFQYQSFTDLVIEEATDILKLDSSDIASLYTAGYKFYTTMDTKTQETAEAIYANDSNFPKGKNDKIVQSALVILDPHTGEIRTLIGGRNQQGERQFNRAVDATRQPGSAFKPVAVYGPALEKGYSPATVLDDFPQEYETPMGPKTFVNYDSATHGYRGLISMRTALQYSVNTVAVKMLERIGVSEGFKFAQNLGITTLVESGKANDMGLSLALGGLTNGVSPLELTAAYGAFANQGIYIKPFSILKIEDKDGNILYEHNTLKDKTIVMSPQTAYLMTDMLQTVVQAGTATNAKLNDRPVAGKTGTTSFDVDAWFMGYTPDLVGAVWMGYDQVENMTNVFGGTNCAPIWKKVMTTAHENIPPSSFPMPEGIVNMEVDYKSGLLPSDLTPPQYIVTENFNSAYVPTEFSNAWIQLPVCADTKKLLTNACPTAITKVFLNRQIPWTGDIAPEDASLEPPKEFCPLHGSGQPSANTALRLQGYPIGNDEITAIKLYWQYPLTSRSTIFQIYRSTQPNVVISPENKIAQVTGAANWQDNNISRSERYYYVITAQDPQTSEFDTPSNEIIVSTVKNPQISSGLKTLQLYGEAHITDMVTVNLFWTKASNDKTIVYYIFRSETPGFQPAPGNQIAVDQSITGTSWTDLGLSKGKTYYYRVVAFNTQTNQQSSPSNQLKVITP